MRKHFLTLLIISALAAGANLYFIIRDWNKGGIGLSIVGYLIAACALGYALKGLRRLDPIQQLQDRLNPRKLDKPVTLIFYGSLEARSIEIVVTHFPAVITEGNFHLRIDEKGLIDVYYDGVLSAQLDVIAILNYMRCSRS